MTWAPPDQPGPAVPVAPVAPAAPVVPATETCEICGRGPSLDIWARMYRGLGWRTDELFWKGRACRQCAVAQYRTALTACLWGGWWAPVAVFVNPLRVGANVRGLVAARRLPDPVGPALATPMDPGPVMWRRPRAWAGALAPLVTVALVVVGVVTLVGDDPLDDLRPGVCLDLPAGPPRPSAAAVSSARVDTVTETDCDGPHDAEVTATGAGDGATVPARCRAALVRYVNAGDTDTGTDTDTDAGTVPSELRAAALVSGDDGDRWTCLLVAAQGSELRGSRRARG